MSDKQHYRIKIKKGDLEIEVQGDKKWVEAKFKELSDEMKSIKLVDFTQPPTPSDPTPSGLPDSISEFLKQKGSPKTHTDRAMVFSYWLSKKKNTFSYNSVDIDQCFQEALIAKPANTNDRMNSNQKKGFLLRAPDKDDLKTWRITSSGEEYVQNMN